MQLRRGASPTIWLGGFALRGPLETVPLPDLRKGIEDELAISGCANYIAKLLAKVASNTNVPINTKMSLPQIFSAAKLQVIPPPALLGRTYQPIGGGEAQGSIADGSAVIVIDQMYKGIYPADQYQHDYILHALHETIHLAASVGRYTDEALANAAFGLMTEGEQKKNRLPTVAPTATPLERANAFSKYWNKQLTLSGRCQ